MPVGRPLTAVARYTCTILTCDPTTTPPTIEAQLKGADARPVSIVAVPGAFRWPAVGETWVIRQENGSWYLDGRASDLSDTLPISSLQPGEMRLDGTLVRNANGTYMMARGDVAGGDLTGTYPNPTVQATLTPVAVSGYVNGWRTYGGGGSVYANPTQYTIDRNGMCELNGLVDKNGGSFVAAEIMFQLAVPLVGNWPIFPAAMNGGGSPNTGQIRVEAASPTVTNVKLGDIGGPANPVGWVSLDTVRWRTR